MKRYTRQREAILNTLYASGRSLSPGEIREEAAAYLPNLSLTTVYRQLQGLVDEAAVEVVTLPGQSPRYEALCVDLDVDPGHHHHHFHCEVCDRVFPIHACPGSMKQLAPKGFCVERHDLTLHGKCDKCIARIKLHA